MRHQQMKVIGHQAEAMEMEPEAELFDRLDQRVQEGLAVFVVPKSLAAFVAARGHVVAAPGYSIRMGRAMAEFVSQSRTHVKFQELTRLISLSFVIPSRNEHPSDSSARQQTHGGYTTHKANSQKA
jgi:hypothetical protein